MLNSEILEELESYGSQSIDFDLIGDSEYLYITVEGFENIPYVISIMENEAGLSWMDTYENGDSINLTFRG